MARMGGWLIVAPVVALAPAAAMALDDIRSAGPVAAAAAGRPILELRPRWNHIEETDRPLTTEGGTARIVAGWRTAPWHGLRITLEGIHAAHFGAERFNDDPSQFATSPYPLLPDPEHTGVNEAHLEYSGIDGLRVTAGRQRLRLDNQRWISDNDFRQVPQLFDGATVALDAFANARFTGGFYRRIRDTSGDTTNIRLVVAHAAWNPLPGHALAAYGYFHDQPETAHFTGFADNSYRALGMRAEGTAWGAGALQATYVAEIAWQRPWAGGDERIRARYWRLGAGIGTPDWTLRYDHEVKGSNRGIYGLQMPLTDFYGFNGWTLHFFTTPRDGLRDRWATGRVALGPVTLYAEWHRFHSDVGRRDYGRELDAGVTWEIVPDTVLRLQHARYDPGPSPAPEIRKTWLTLTYTY